MYLQDGVCAQCGKKLHETAKFSPHNTVINNIPGDRDDFPYFCSPRCSLAASDEYIEEGERWGTTTYYYPKLQDNLLKLAGLEADIERENVEHKDKLAYLEEWYQRDKESFDTTYRRTPNYPDDTPFYKEYWAKRRKEEERHTTKLTALLTKQKETESERDYNLKAVTEMSVGRANTIFCHAYAKAKKQAIEATKPPPPPIITDQHRFEHTHILGPSGSGKTTLIQDLILKDLAQDSPAMVVIDPKGFMVEQVARLKSLPKDKVIYLDPLATPPLNLFKQGNRAVITQAIANFDYIFSQAGSPLTSKMRPVFKFCARLMFNIPNADIFLLMDFLDSQQGDPRFAPYIANLDDLGAKRFFERDFYSAKLYGETRQQIKGRFNDILSMPEVLAMFTAPQSLDFIQALNEKKIILVNTRAAEIGMDASQLVGRYIIALTLSAVFARGRNANPVWLYVDEFQDFVDEEATPRHFRLAREYRLGIIAAHQNMFCNELTESLRTAISGNTAIKYCAKVSGADRAYMLRDLGCDEAFLDKQVSDKAQQLVKFACAVRGHPTFSISVKYPSITPDMLSDAKPQPLQATQTHKPPETSGLRALERMPAEADPPIIPQPVSPPSTKTDDSDSATDW